jgi:hypothetical protein
MANPKKPKTEVMIPAGTPTPTIEAAEPPELPIVNAIGLAKVPRGWVVVKLQTQGDRVIDKEILTEPEARVSALMDLRIAVAKNLMLVE